MVQLEFHQAGQVVEVRTVGNFFEAEAVLFGIAGHQLVVDKQPLEAFAFVVAITHAVFYFAVVAAVQVHQHAAVFVYVEVAQVRAVHQHLSPRLQQFTYLLKKATKAVYGAYQTNAVHHQQKGVEGLRGLHGKEVAVDDLLHAAARHHFAG